MEKEYNHESHISSIAVGLNAEENNEVSALYNQIVNKLSTCEKVSEAVEELEKLLCSVHPKVFLLAMVKVMSNLAVNI